MEGEAVDAKAPVTLGQWDLFIVAKAGANLCDLLAGVGAEGDSTDNRRRCGHGEGLVIFEQSISERMGDDFALGD